MIGNNDMHDKIIRLKAEMCQHLTLKLLASYLLCESSRLILPNISILIKICP
jgi:hypothetical protein